MPYYAYAIIFGIILAAVYIALKGVRFGFGSLDDKDLGGIIGVALSGGSIIPIWIIMAHVIGGGIDKCLPDDFGQMTRFSLVIGAFATGYYAFVSIKRNFSKMLNPETE